MISDIALIDTLIIFEILAKVNTYFKKGGENLYEKYAKLRDEAGVTDYEVGKRTGIATSTFSNWKAGRYSPKIDKLKRIADFFGKSIEYFLE